MAKRDGLVLVSGATGRQGGAIGRELLDAGWKVRAMTRKPESEAAQLMAARGAEIVRADLNDEESLRRVLDGAWGAVAVQNTWEGGVAMEEEQGHRFARVAKEVGVQHLLYQSVASADRNTGIPHFDNKWRIEQTIRGLEFPSWTIVRPVFFMENLLTPWFKPSIDEGKLAIGMSPSGTLQVIAVHDIGKYGLQAFERQEEMNGRAIDIAGDELTGPEAAAILSEVTGRKIEFQSTPIEQVRSASEEYALMLEWFDAVGYDADIEGNAAEFGIRPTRFREWAARQKWG
ncbi:MAG TPA: NmrA/HSCARG family protein [Gemmatimonadaceae bacterium]|nr:NmrA/HSCARG family protein [Gemmatimonadaceae bacterium]